MLLTALALAAAPPVAVVLSPEVGTAAAPAPREVRSADMVGDLHLPAGSRPAPAILLLGGSEGGLGRSAARQAALLAAHGYVVLHLSYFGGVGQPTALKAIPLETFFRALDWLKAQPRTMPGRLGIVGTSKGAEAALLVASRRSDVAVAILGVPSSVAWPGISMSEMVTESSWTEGGKSVPFTPYGWTGEWKGIHALYADGLAGPAKASAGVIPAERARADVVLICGEADALWPSCPMARAVEARLRRTRYPHRVTLLAYPDAGHSAFGPPAEPGSPPPTTIGALGGTVAGNVAARADGRPKALAALDAALKPGATR